MVFRGRVQNGVVVLENADELPEGAHVTVVCDADCHMPSESRADRVQLPLVHSRHPGSVKLMPEQVAEALEDEDVSS